MLKRVMDVTIALAALLLLAPVMLIIALLIRMKLGRPVIFKQERAGLHGKPFYILKFRTMTDARDESGQLLPDEQRMTPLGSFLR